VQYFFVFQFGIKNLKTKIYRTIILPLVLYGSETWSLTLREERRLRVFENRVLRRMFGPKRDEVKEGVDLNPLNAELNPICHLLALLGAHHIFHVIGLRVNDQYSSPDIFHVIKSRRTRWAGM